MKTKHFIIIILLIVISMVLIGFNFFQETLGPHGGQVKEAEKYNIEMRMELGNFYAYLLNKKLKPIKNNGISCEVRFTFPDNTIVDSSLKPFEEDGFITEVYNQFLFCKITFDVGRESVSATFQNELLIVQNKPK